MARTVRARLGLGLLFLGGMVAGSFTAWSADTWPNCSFNCTAGDVSLTSVVVELAGGACEPGGSSSARVYGRFVASARRYAVILIGDLIVGGRSPIRLESCAGDLTAGTTDVLLATVAWPCGSAVSLANVTVSWSAGPESCSSATCASRVAKCSSGGDITVSVPLVVDFTSNSPQCFGAPILFADATTGGTAPLVYSWDFGDGGTSSQTNPTHAYTAPGTYTVTLTVRDRTGSDSHSRSVTVSPVPAATAANNGPYCPGETISLLASGGGSYRWSGPNGFSSSQQNPTIASAGATKAGSYTVTVTNSAGCSAEATTIVVVDSTPPVLTAPASTTVACGYPTGPAATGQATATDNSGRSPTIAYADAAQLTGCSGTGTIRRTWTATDACGNSASATQTITVVDTTAPALLLPTDTVVECGHSTSPSATGHATATDLCGTPVLAYVDRAILTGCGGAETIARTWTATDPCGNTATGVQTITLVDSLSPTLTVPGDTSVGCGDTLDPAATGLATAADACSVPSVTYVDAANLTGCSGSGTVMRTWTARDACGRSTSAVQIITVRDDDPPRLTTPVDVIVECGHSTTPDATGHASATDDCSTTVVTYVDDLQLTGCGGTGTIVRTWTATDACGHGSTSVQRISVVDSLAPLLTVPGDVTVTVGASVLPAATGHATAVDECESATVSYSDQESLGVDGAGSILRTWMASDACGHRAVGTQTITVVGAPPPPTLTLSIPAATTVEAGHPRDPSATGWAIASTTCPTPPTLTYSDVEDLTGCDETGAIQRTWVASDACGNTATGVQTITVMDTGGVVLTVPADITIETESPTDPSTTGWATASDPDAVDEPPTVTYSDVGDLSGCDGTGAIIRTWTAVDECGNATIGVQTIFVVDSGHILLAVPPDVVVQSGDPTTPDASGWATASDPDAVDEPPVVTYFDAGDLSGCDGTGRILRTWTATDECGNTTTSIQTLTVVDTTAPMLTVPADIIIETVDPRDPSFTGWASVGHHDPAYAPTLSYDDEADLTGCDGTGTIRRTWTAADACGNAVTGVQTITVVDSGHVSVLIPPDIVIECGHATAPDVTGWATASDPDAVDEAPTVSYEDTFEASGCGGAGTILRTWTGSDECGNAVSAVQTITIVDATPPTLVVPDDVTVDYGASTEPGATGRAGAIDACSPVTVSRADESIPGPCGGRETILRTWTATDECGNRVSGVQTIAVVDSTAPRLSLPADAIVECGRPTGPEAAGRAVAFDASGTVELSHVDRELPEACGGTVTILRTWTATDACGNAASGIQTISVIDSTPPELTTPPDVSVEVGESTLPSRLGQASATDGCSSATVTYADAAALAADGTGTIVRTWTAIDACGNSAVGRQSIAVTSGPPLPQLHLAAPADRTVDAGTTLDPSVTGTAVAAGNCAGGVNVTYDDAGALTGCDGTGTIQRTWTAVDACGNRATAVQVITVVDRGQIQLAIPGDLSLRCGSPVDPALTGMAAAYDPDATDTPPAVTYVDTSALDPCSGAGTILRTWTATDECGNSVSAIQTITVTGSCVQRVIISEVAWSGTAADSESQWIELRNLGDDEVDLVGWTLRWRRAKPETAEDTAWTTMPLSGAIAAATQDVSLPFGPNPQDSETWWVDLSGRQARRDFLLLERLSDDTVRDVPAGFVYDELGGARSRGFSSLGDVLELVSPTGCVVDTANAPRDGVGGWMAGDPATRGTMERTDPYGPDVAENWHTNLGVITSGLDALGEDLLATAGLENEPQLARMVALAAQDALPIGGGAALSIPLPGPTQPAAGEPARVVAISPTTGAAILLPLGVSESGQAVTLEASGAIPSGQHAVWLRIGEVALLVLVQGP